MIQYKLTKEDFDWLNDWYWCEDCGHRITKEEEMKNLRSYDEKN